MGINGLLPIIRPILTKKHISSYRGKRIGIDGHAWLYQIAPSIAHELFFGVPTTKHIQILSSKIRSLQSNGIHVIFVFDGESLKSKSKTLVERTRKKEAAKAETLKLLKANNVAKAREMMKRCVHITNEVMVSVLEFLRKEKIEFIISPYESDAQLAYLQRIGYIDYILTEDSDLILYDSTKILYKYDLFYVDEYEKDRLGDACGEFFAKNIVDICILSGCDYVAGLSGVGIKTACKLLMLHSSVEGVVEAWKTKMAVPDNFLSEFARAKLTFLHQVVFDPHHNKRVFLSGDFQQKPEFDFLGSFIENEEQFSRGYNLQNKDKISFFVRRSKDDDSTKRIAIPELPVPTQRSDATLIVDEKTVSPYFQK